MTRSATALGLFVVCALGAPAHAQDPQLSQFGAGDGPTLDGKVLKLLTPLTRGQSNAAAFARKAKGAFEKTTLRAKLKVRRGGDGGAFVFLNTRTHGTRGPAPFVRNWTEPNLEGAFAVGIDVHNPMNTEMFGPWGNYRGMPQREVSLHWDGREIVKRLSPVEFRGDPKEWTVELQHVIGGAEVTVQVGDGKVYDRYFIPGLLPYEARLAVGASTRGDSTTDFDVSDIRFAQEGPAKRRRAPKHVEVFNHVLTNNKKTFYETEVMLPPRQWEFGRVILTLDIHDAGPDWDEWDRNGEISVYDKDGQKRGIVPFITSYRTECHWEVDVTHFRPWLCDKTKFEVRAGTTFYKNRGYMMSVKLDFYHGKEPGGLEAYRIEPVWNGTARYKSAENAFKDFFEAKEITVDAAAKAARLFMTTTGHSQVGEFVPSKRTVVVGEQRYKNTLWKDDCYLNPNRPQFGTWKFSRAGWAPGDVVRPWWIDLALDPGKPAAFRYEPQPYDFGTGKAPAQKEIDKASHVVRSYLILYREPAERMPAPSLMISNVQGGSNAAKAGLKRGDYLASYDGKPVNSLADLRAALGAVAKEQRKIPVVAYRGAKRLELELDPGRMGVNLSER